MPGYEAVSAEASKISTGLVSKPWGVLQALISAAKVERSPAVKRAYASSAAQVARFAPEARAAQLAVDVVQLYGDPGDQPSRQLAGMIARELARQAPDTFTAHAATVRLG